ncbi:ATP-binding domain-containing protein [Balneatrix alpica]|uniref:ATP-binding protein n=1 Tax=Balneatrix alpica TaxID=75684 RepID=A0ABV5ZBU1_9GAMM|nr:ATP-binding domain-containing protein [Balneatrix alpica]
MAHPTLMSWSSGKDSAWALYQLQQQPEYQVKGLFCTLNAEFQRVAMHGVRKELVEAQAAAAGLPLYWIDIPYPCSNADYAARMSAFIDLARELGITHMAFGDLFLQDVRAYRESQLAPTGMTPVFPLWGQATPALARTMQAGGLKARLTCVDPRQLSAEMVGRDFDAAFLADLPQQVDPCGENGEFHSFAYAGPMFNQPIPIRTGEIVERDGFCFADLLPA